MQYAIAYAIENGIPFQGGEPSDKQIHEALLKKGYSLKDIAAFSWLREIPQLIRQGKINDANYAQRQQEFYVQGGANGLSLSEAEFKDWYKSQYGKTIVLTDVTPQYCRPSRSAGATLAQRISHDIGIVRDSNIIEVTAKALTAHKSVMIQYGAGHHVQQRRILRKMLPNYSCSN